MSRQQHKKEIEQAWKRFYAIAAAYSGVLQVWLKGNLGPSTPLRHIKRDIEILEVKR
jgi:hypothetical protein